CVLFGMPLLAVFVFHFVTSRFRLGEALKSDGPMLLSVGLGMSAGLASWVVGIWGASANLKDAAPPPPYTKSFFVARLLEWIGSMQPVIVVPFIALASGSTILLARRRRVPAETFDVPASWWLFPLWGLGSVVLGAGAQVSGDPNSPVVPYYRFMNATAAPMALVGIGASALIWWARTQRDRRSLVRGFVLIVGVVAVAWAVDAMSLTKPQIPWQVLGGVAVVAIAGLGAVAFARSEQTRRVFAVAAASALVLGSLGSLLIYGVNHRWVSAANQYPNESVRGSLAAVDVVARAA